MFQSCSGLTELDVSGFDISAAEDVDWMFQGCTALKTIWCKDKDSAWIAEDGIELFDGCTSLFGYCDGKRVNYDSSKTNADMAKSANLGGYFTPKGQTIPAYTPGDANGDEQVNARDIALIQRYVAKWDVELNLDAADVNDDEQVNARDIALIQRYVAKWDVVLK